MKQPHNIEAEQIVIASCLIDSTAYDRVSPIVGADDFFAERHKTIFACIAELASERSEYSEVELFEKLKANGSLEEIGGVSSIYAIEERVETSLHAVSSAKIVKDKSRLRQIARKCRLALESIEEEQESGDIVAELEGSVAKIMDSDAQEKTIAQSVDTVLEEMHSPDLGTSLPFGIESYDRSLRSGGMKPKQIHVIAARPGNGKTTLALNVAARTARDGNAVGFFSLEMGDDELVEKLIFCAANVDAHKVEEGVASPKELERIEEQAKRIRSWPLHINDKAQMTPGLMTSIARQWKRRYDIKLLIVDYLQLLKGDDTKQSREAQVAEMSRSMKCLAKELHLPVMVLSQLNRECEKENRAPRLSDLRESGAIEQDADTVTFLYTLNEDRNVDAPGDNLRWVRAKQRAGQSYAEGQFKFRRHTGLITDFS